MSDQSRLIERLLAVERAAVVVANGDPERTHPGLHAALEALDAERARIANERARESGVSA